MGNSLLARVPLPVKLGALLGMTLLAAACGSSSSSSAPANTAAPAAGSSSSAPAAAGSGLMITTKTGAMGTYLTDGTGRTLYLWVKDPSGKSVCSGPCAKYWPPVTTTGTVTAGGSAVAADLGTFTRSDGTKQVTYDGHALYYFLGDGTTAGKTTGQGSSGFGAKWWLVAPSGASITAAASATSSGSTSGKSSWA